LAAWEAEIAKVEAGPVAVVEQPEPKEERALVVVSAKAVLNQKPDDTSAKKKPPPKIVKPKRKREEDKPVPTVPLPPDMKKDGESEHERHEPEPERKPKIISAPPHHADPEEIKLLETALPEDIVSANVAPIINVPTLLKTTVKEKKLFLRKAAGKIWADHSLADWPDGDNRIFCGDLGNEVNDNTLAKVFVKYSSFAKAKVIRDKRTQKTKGYGFVSFLDPFDAAQALKEMQGAYVGNRPIKLRKSNWTKREHVPKGRKKNHLF